MEYNRILAVGDIHGMYEKLVSLMELMQFHPDDDLLIFLGDYIDRGPQSLECLDYVMTLNRQHPERVICLRGNHEQMCLQYYKERSGMTDFYGTQYSMWKDNGGNKTKRQFYRYLSRPELQKRLSWMQTLSTHYQVGDFYFCHAGIQPFIPLDKQKERDLLWIREAFYDLYDGRFGTIVIGHTPVQELLKKYWKDDQPPTTPQFLENKIILCDTGAFIDGGKLSGVDVLTGEYWQV